MSKQLADDGGDFRQTGSPKGLIILLTFLVGAIILGLTISSLYREKKSSLQAAETKTSAQAQLLGESATSTLYDVDLILLATKHLLEDDTVEEGTFPRSIEMFIRAQLNFLPQVTGMAYLSTTGKLLYSSGTWEESALPSLIAHRDEWLELFVGATQQGDDARILLSRRVENRAGVFIGVLAAEIAPNFFYQKYENYLGIDVAAIVLFNIDGTVLSGWYNDHQGQHSFAGISLQDVPLFSSLAKSLPLAGGLQLYDDSANVISTSQLTDFPFHIAVAGSKELVLAKWLAAARKNLAVLAISALLAGATTMLAWSHRKKRWQAENQLRLHQLHLEEMVEERTKKISLMNKELLQKNEDLQLAMTEINTLSSFLPICSHCKKIRDDKGYWSQVEEYIGSRTGTQFSHGICPRCAAIHYPDFYNHDKTDDA
ncbi:PDC sensor domain-containing protein [Desulfocastanea catecholica]